MFTEKHVGIGTEQPEDNFQVNDGPSKLVIGNAYDIGWGTSYLGFNGFRQRGSWILSTDGAHNGGEIVYGDIFGNMHFINVPSDDFGNRLQTFSDSEMVQMTRMTISKDGNVGIGTRNPSVALDIHRNGTSIIRSSSLGNYTSALWAMNYNGGFGLSVD